MNWNAIGPASTAHCARTRDAAERLAAAARAEGERPTIRPTLTNGRGHLRGTLTVRWMNRTGLRANVALEPILRAMYDADELVIADTNAYWVDRRQKEKAYREALVARGIDPDAEAERIRQMMLKTAANAASAD